MKTNDNPPQPKSFPVTLDKFLCLCLPKLAGRKPEKYALYRRWLAAATGFHAWKLKGDCGLAQADFKPSTEAAGEMLKEDRARPFTTTEFYEARTAFLKWYQAAHASDISTARRDAANASVKVREKKRLEAKRKAQLKRRRKTKLKKKL